MFERYCVGEAYTIKEVLEQFENCNDRVAVVLNDSNKVIGVGHVQGDHTAGVLFPQELIYI